MAKKEVADKSINISQLLSEFLKFYSKMNAIIDNQILATSDGEINQIMVIPFESVADTETDHMEITYKDIYNLKSDEPVIRIYFQDTTNGDLADTIILPIKEVKENMDYYGLIQKYSENFQLFKYVFKKFYSKDFKKKLDLNFIKV